MKIPLQSNPDSLTTKFLNLIGSPFIDNRNVNYELNGLDSNEISKLYYYAIKNRMVLHFLESLKKANKLVGSMKTEYDRLIVKYSDTNDVIQRASNVLDKTGAQYALFKSVRPYEEVTVDIDVLVFGNEFDYEKVISTLYQEDYDFLGDGPLSKTFRDRIGRVGLDIYYEVGVSHIIYMNKDNFKSVVSKRKIRENQFALSLSPTADLLAVIAHSVIKEQMYVLSEYYTTLYYLADMSDEELKSFLDLADRCKLTLAVKTHLGITALLHYRAHGSIPDSIRKLLKVMGVNPLELSRIEEKGLLIPYKYHPITIIRALFEKFREHKARRSLAKQFYSLLNINFTSSFVGDLLKHINREAY